MGHQVLIVGAGPTGLSLGLWLIRLGVDVRIIDRAPTPGMTSRAIRKVLKRIAIFQLSLVPLAFTPITFRPC